jgi:hypothetical protein
MADCPRRTSGTQEGNIMTALEQAALARDVMSKEFVATIYNAGPLTSGITRDTVRDICASHERLRMELAGAELMIGQLDAEIAALREATK